jgi:hypothetical protein
MKTVIAVLLVFTSMMARAESTLFASNENQLSFFGTYVDGRGDDWGLGAGYTRYLTENLGVGAVTYWKDFNGAFIDNLGAEGYYRFPLDDLRLAPYAVASAGYSFELEELFFAFGGGAEFRLNERLGLFGDLRWQINNDTKDGATLRVGARLMF